MRTEVVVAGECGVLRRLVGGEVSDEPVVPASGDVAVDEEHASAVTGAQEQLAEAAVGVGVACKHLALFVRPIGKSATPEEKISCENSARACGANAVNAHGDAGVFSEGAWPARPGLHAQ